MACLNSEVPAGDDRRVVVFDIAAIDFWNLFEVWGLLFVIVHLSPCASNRAPSFLKRNLFFLSVFVCAELWQNCRCLF
jgi:hypothetical protein